MGTHVLVRTAITSFHVPRYLTSFSASMFDDSTSLEQFSVDPDNTRYAYFNNAIMSKQLTTLEAFPPKIDGEYTIPEKVRTLATCAFARSSLTYVNFPSTLVSISSWCFNGAKIKELKFPPSLKTIYSSAFRSCNSITEIIFVEGIETIESSAFQSCSSLITVQFPSSLKTLGGGVFKDCPDNINITFNSNSNLKFDQTRDWIVTKNETIISQCLGNEQSYEIPASYEVIASSAFQGITELVKITFLHP